MGLRLLSRDPTPPSQQPYFGVLRGTLGNYAYSYRSLAEEHPAHVASTPSLNETPMAAKEIALTPPFLLIRHASDCPRRGGGG